MVIRHLILVTLVTLLSACGDVAPPATPTCTGVGAGGYRYLTVTTSDYLSTGKLVTLNLTSGGMAGKPLPIHSDAVVRPREKNRGAIVVNRMPKDNLQGIAADFLSVLFQWQPAGWTNLQDVLTVGDTAWISSYERNGVAKVDLATRAVEEVSFANLKDKDGESTGDDDGSPEPTWLHAEQGTLWVVLQRLNRNEKFFPPQPKAMVALVDMAGARATSLLPLLSMNPVSRLKRGADGMLYLAEAGRLGKEHAEDGLVERFDPATGQSLGKVTTEKQLGGDIFDVEIVSADRGIAIVATPTAQELVVFDPRTGAKIKSLPKFAPYTLTRLVWDETRDLVYVADGTRSAPKIRAYATSDFSEKTEMACGLPLPPYQMELVK